MTTIIVEGSRAVGYIITYTIIMSRFNTLPMDFDEVDTEQLTISERVSRTSDGYSANIKYDNKTLLIVTPILRIVFPLRKYDYGSIVKKHALCLSLDPSQDYAEAFRVWLEEINEMAKSQMGEYEGEVEKLNQYKQIHYHKEGRFPPYLRCKMVNNKEQFKCDIFKNGEKMDGAIDYVDGMLKKGVKVQCHLQLNPLWKFKDRYGVSYQIKAINVLDEQVEVFKSFGEDR